MGDGGRERNSRGTCAHLTPGDLIGPGYNSHFGSGKVADHDYLTATLDAAVWGAEPAIGEGPGRIHIVESTGPVEDDPNLTDKEFPGNPTRSYRARDPPVVRDEPASRDGHAPDVLQVMEDNVERLGQLDVEAIDD